MTRIADDTDRERHGLGNTDCTDWSEIITDDADWSKIIADDKDLQNAEEA